MSTQTYFRLCLFVPLLVPLPFLLFKGDEGLSSLFIGSLVFGMPPYVLVFVLPFLFLFGKLSERQIVMGTVFFPVVYPLVFGSFWFIVPNFINSMTITLSNPSQWIFTSIMIPAAYSMLFLSGNIVRKMLNGEMGILEQRIAAVLCADFNTTRQPTDKKEVETVKLFDNYHGIFDTVIKEHRGQRTNYAGDSMVVEFASVINAVKCALSLQQKIRVMNTEQSSGKIINMGIGINLGDVRTKDNNICGDGVTVAASLQEQAEAGAICISGSVYDCIRKKLIFSYDYLGERSLKEIKDPVRVYRLLVEAATSVPVTGIAPVVTPAIPDKPVIAVLPFDNMSSDPEQEYFSDGMTEDIITDLSKLSDLTVISRHSTFVYKGKSVSSRQVSQELGARYVLEGSVRKSDNRIRITAQLIDATLDDHIWAGKFDRELEDIFTIQDEVVGQIVNELKINIKGEEKLKLQNKGTENIEAHDSFLRGQENFYKFNKEGIARGRAWLSHAIELDPDYAEAYAFKARILVYEWLTGMNESPEQTLKPAIQLAGRAIEINPRLPAGYLYLGWAIFWNGDKDEGIRKGKQALELGSNDADARLFLGIMLVSNENADAALTLVDEIKRLNPLYKTNIMYLFALGIIFQGLGKPEEAIDMLNKANEINPNFIPRHIWYITINIKLGRDEEAKRGIQEILRIVPDFSVNGFRKFLTQNEFKFVSARLLELGVSDDSMVTSADNHIFQTV